MLGFFIWGLVIGGALTAIVLAVRYLNKDRVRNDLKDRGLDNACIQKIVEDDGITHIYLDAIDEDGNPIEIVYEAEDYNHSEIREGMTIEVLG